MSARYFLLTAFLFSTCFAAVHRGAVAQDSKSDDVRRLLQLLQDKLGEEQSAPAAPSNSKTTEIGALSQQPVVPKEPPLVVRVYDLSDLFAIAPAYPAIYQSDFSPAAAARFPIVSSQSEGAGFGGGGLGGGLGGGGGGFFNVQDSLGDELVGGRGNLGAARVSLNELIDVIIDTIRPNDWQKHGGKATISRLGNSLLISATSETHEQIDNLLKLFRERWGTLRTISVRAYWLWLSDQQLDAALVNDGSETPIAYGVVSDPKWVDLQEQLATDKQNSGYRAAITFYNGQTVHAMSGGQRLLVTGVSPSLGEGKAIGYTPETAVIQTGAALQITGMATRRAEFVVLDLHSRVSVLKSPESARHRGSALGPSAGKRL